MQVSGKNRKNKTENYIETSNRTNKIQFPLTVVNGSSSEPLILLLRFLESVVV